MMRFSPGLPHTPPPTIEPLILPPSLHHSWYGDAVAICWNWKGPYRIILGMPRPMTPAEYRRAVEKYNREVRDHNNKVAAAERERQRAIDRYNRDARDHNNKVVAAAKAYDREVRQYNFKVNAHNREVVNQRRRVQDEIRRLNARSATVSVTYRQSVQDLASSYEAVEGSLSTRPVLSDAENRFRDWASAEAANSAYLANALEGDTAADDDTTAEDLVTPSMTVELSSFSDDLVQRWGGALYALNPRNPDAARHFCTSAREVLTTMLDTSAPNQSVLSFDSNCEQTKDGAPTRRAKIKFLLARNGIADASMDSFVEADMDSVLKLFRMFNDGTHGHAGKFSISQLAALRTRVESAITFVYRLTSVG